MRNKASALEGRIRERLRGPKERREYKIVNKRFLLLVTRVTPIGALDTPIGALQNRSVIHMFHRTSDIGSDQPVSNQIRVHACPPRRSSDITEIAVTNHIYTGRVDANRQIHIRHTDTCVHTRTTAHAHTQHYYTNIHFAPVVIT